VLSAPLKLVLDVLDLAWDQVTEVLSDLWGTATGWLSGTLGWLRDKVLDGYDWVMGSLVRLKDKLLRKKEE
jgi:hypothetical protein